MSQQPPQQAAPNDAAPADTPPTPPPPTLEEQVAGLNENITKLTGQIAQAADLAARADASARRAQGQHGLTVKRLERELQSTQKALDEVMMRDMTEEQRMTFQTRRELDQIKNRESAAPDNSAAVPEFQDYSGRVLNQYGVASDDPRLRAAFERYVGESNDPATWRQSLYAAIADVKADDAKVVAAKSAEGAKLAREEERARAEAERRKAGGPVDRGAPRPTSAQKNVWEMSDEEFATFERQKDASVGRQPSTPRAP